MLNNRLLWPRRLLVTLLLVSAFQPVLAQQEDARQRSAQDTAGPDSDQTQESSVKKDDKNQPAPTSRPAADTVFKPSEEISEDLSVPFPIDI